MSSGREVSEKTLDGLSRDMRGDCEEIHPWERKKQGNQTHLREIMGDVGSSKIQGKKGNIIGGLESKTESWKKGSGFSERRSHLSLDQTSGC